MKTFHDVAPIAKRMAGEPRALTDGLEGEATVLQVVKGAGGPLTFTLVLDRTVFYPQGGGQPSDTGHIEKKASAAKFIISKVTLDKATGLISHTGQGEEEFAVGDSVRLYVDPQKRHLHSRFHSAGHLMDHAMQLLNWPLHVASGYHFPSGPYVEYKHLDEGEIANSPLKELLPQNIPRMLQLLEEKCHEIIRSDWKVQVHTLAPDEVPPKWNELLTDGAKEAKVQRFIEFVGAPLPRPCSGTHVTRTGEIGLSFRVKRLTLTKPEGNYRISYTVDAL